MTLVTLDHYNIRTEKLAETVDFYSQVLGMVRGHRPGVQDPRIGAWMYIGGHPVVHISAVDRNDPEFTERVNRYLGERDLDSLQGGGAIDHVAFNATGFDEMIARLRAAGPPFASG